MDILTSANPRTRRTAILFTIPSHTSATLVLAYSYCHNIHVFLFQNTCCQIDQILTITMKHQQYSTLPLHPPRQFLHLKIQWAWGLQVIRQSALLHRYGKPIVTSLISLLRTIQYHHYKLSQLFYIQNQRLVKGIETQPATTMIMFSKIYCK